MLRNYGEDVESFKKFGNDLEKVSQLVELYITDISLGYPHLRLHTDVIRYYFAT